MDYIHRHFSTNQQEKTYMLGAVAKGKTVDLKKVNDPAFSLGMLGQGIAIIPSEGKIYAPADGEITMVFETLHAVSMTADSEAEILVHVGLDTAELKGEGFEAHVKAGDKVKKGDLLVSVDLALFQSAGYDIMTVILVCNPEKYAAVEGFAGREVVPGEDVVEIRIKNQSGRKMMVRDLANNEFTEMAKIVLEGVGGPANVTSIDNCITRLRLGIKDCTLVDEGKIKSAGVAGVIRPGKTAVQVIIGTKVPFVADEFKKLCR